jgi:Fe-S-cluster containining protein
MDGRKIDLIVHSLHKEVIAQVDCLLCGNCCSCLSPEVNDNDLKTLAGREDMLPEEYLSVYCKEESGIFFKSIPCRYLEGKCCSIYVNRPEQCKKFPYTAEKGFIFRLWGMIENYGMCPVVFNIMERLKDKLGFRYGRRY